MNPNLTAVTLIILALSLFFTFTDSEYAKVKDLREKSADYEVAKQKSKDLLAKRDELKDKYSSIDPFNIMKLEKLLPNTIDSVKLVIEINGIAEKYGIKLKNVQINTASIDKNTSPKEVNSDKKYNSALVTFAVSTTYDNFIQFLRGLEHNLRITDVVSTTFSAPDDGGLYSIAITIRSYWMK
ncbi:MAG: hypothetical protein Q7R78_02335 [bacterium]|nr:hypothetical protein [bacterium]